MRTVPSPSPLLPFFFLHFYLSFFFIIFPLFVRQSPPVSMNAASSFHLQQPCACVALYFEDVSHLPNYIFFRDMEAHRVFYCFITPNCFHSFCVFSSACVCTFIIRNDFSISSTYAHEQVYAISTLCVM